MCNASSLTHSKKNREGETSIYSLSLLSTSRSRLFFPNAVEAILRAMTDGLNSAWTGRLVALAGVCMNTGVVVLVLVAGKWSPKGGRGSHQQLAFSGLGPMARTAIVHIYRLHHSAFFHHHHQL